MSKQKICYWCKEPSTNLITVKNPVDNSEAHVHVICLKRWRQYWLAAAKQKRKDAEAFL